MRMSEGVEWAAHACVALAGLPEGRGISAAALAALHELPPAYMAKHLQALARAGVVRAERGPRGGYRLARRPSEISLLQIVEAIEGAGPGFRCQEIRKRGPCAAREPDARPCTVAAALWGAEAQWRRSLAATSLADLAVQTARHVGPKGAERFAAWLSAVL